MHVMTFTVITDYFVRADCCQKTLELLYELGNNSLNIKCNNEAINERFFENPAQYSQSACFTA
jgi:hypothetical protein